MLTTNNLFPCVSGGRALENTPCYIAVASVSGILAEMSPLLIVMEKLILEAEC